MCRDIYQHHIALITASVKPLFQRLFYSDTKHVGITSLVRILSDIAVSRTVQSRIAQKRVSHNIRCQIPAASRTLQYRYLCPVNRSILRSLGITACHQICLHISKI